MTAGYVLLRVSKLRPSCQVILCGLQPHLKIVYILQKFYKNYSVQFILKKNSLLSDTSDSHSSDCKDYSFLRCDPVRFGSQLSTTEDL